jgi:hypothetical protein
VASRARTGWRWRSDVGATLMETSLGSESPLTPLGLAGLTLLLSSLFLIAHARYPGLPTPGTETGGWGAWFDQSQYLKAARAWAHWNLSPALHWYPPGYALLGAPFLLLTPHDRFLIPNLTCLIVSQFACAALARRLFPENRFARLLGAGAFLIASIGTMPGLKSWLVPWTTTPSAALAFVSFVVVLRLAERPGIGTALLAGSAVGGITLFRPGDTAPVAVAAAVALAPVLLALPIREAIGVIVASVLATGAWVAVTLGIIAATSGFGPGTYYAQSAKIGFEIRLVLLHWVTFMIDGRPVFDGVGAPSAQPGLHRGMCEVFPWIIPGIGGIAACWFGRNGKRVHVLLVTWLALYLVLMLSYRDFHIIGLWLYGNYHYFKVTQPIFFLYALVLASRLADRTIRWRVTLAALVAIVLALGWRVGLTPLTVNLPPATAKGISLPPLNHIDEAAIVRGTGSWSALYFDNHLLMIDGKAFHDPYDFRLYPRSRDFLVLPLRPLPKGPATLTDVQDLPRIEVGAPAVAARQTISFGMPCAFGLAGRSVCGSGGTPLTP